jgi:hypothetical protein
MASSNSDKIINTFLDLIKVLFGAGLTWFSSWLTNRSTEKRRLQRELELKTALELSQTNGNRSRALQGLRRFFIANRPLLESHISNQEFFGEHLVEIDDVTSPSDSFWSPQKIKLVLRYLSKLKV